MTHQGKARLADGEEVLYVKEALGPVKNQESVPGSEYGGP